MSAGFTGQVGAKNETTWGTAVAVDHFHPVLSADFQPGFEFKMVEDIRGGGMGAKCRALVKERPSGNVSMNLYPAMAAKYLRQMFGAVNTTGSGPYTHAFTRGNTLPSMTWQDGIPVLGGTVTPFTFAGMKVNKGTFKGSPGNEVTLDLELLGKSASVATGLATASYVTGCPFFAGDVTVTVEGTDYTADRLLSWELTVDNRLADRDRMTRYRAEPVRDARPTITGSLEVEFVDNAPYTAWAAGTQLTIVFAMTNGTETLTITCEASYTGTAPALNQGITKLSLPFEHWGGAVADADSFKAVLVNSESTAT